MNYSDEMMENLKGKIKWEQINNQCLFELIELYKRKEFFKDQLLKRGVNNIAVYGLGKVGRAFVNLLNDVKISIPFCIDMNKNVEIEGIEILHSFDDVSEEADYLVVTVELEYDIIRKEIEKRTSIQCIVLRDLLEGLLLIPNKL